MPVYARALSANPAGDTWADGSPSARAWTAVGQADRTAPAPPQGSASTQVCKFRAWGGYGRMGGCGIVMGARVLFLG
jgi:hypothetical protein